MEIIRRDQVQVLSKPGLTSHQLLFPENSTSERLTITRVVVDPGGVNSRHRHAASEQVWVALHGAGILLLAEMQRRRLRRETSFGLPMETFTDFGIPEPCRSSIWR